ncbi:hypothetical protein D047_3023A, partial [Vibrio parahaemolyticus VPTS-2010_2]
MRNATNG